MIHMGLDVESIRKLMEDDPQFIIDIKKGVVENIIKKSIVPILNLSEIKKAIFDVKVANQEAMKFWDDMNYPYAFRLGVVHLIHSN